MTQTFLVLGGGDLGSAVAHRLFLHGADVVLADGEAPAHPRRGMAFTDAWFSGCATLEGVVALRVRELGELAAHRAHLDAVAATTVSPQEMAAALRLDAVIDARMRKRSVPEDLRRLAPIAIGLGPGFTPGGNCTLAIETAWGNTLGAVLRDAPASALAGEPRALGGAGRERLVYAATDGHWRTQARIGDRVEAGAPLGTLAGAPVHAPLSGAIRGLAHDGVFLRARQKFIEIDPRAEPDIFGLGQRPALIARGVAAALGLPVTLEQAFFGFEAHYQRTLQCMPISLRRKLDACGLKLSLAQWRALPRPLRETLLEAPADTPRATTRLAQLLRRRAERMGWPDLACVPPECALGDPNSPYPAVVSKFAADGLAPPDHARWRALTPLQRYALGKLARRGGDGHSALNWREALVEFRLVAGRPG